MPIITAAITAVAAAIATTTIATVATAAVAVGTLVGTVGLGVSVIGMATGNKTLTKIGGYMGMAGGVMGLAGGLAGGMAGYAKTLSTAWDDGVGSLFSSTKAVGQTGLEQEALGRGIVSATNPEAASHFAQTGQSVANTQEALGRGIVAGTRMPASTATQPTVLSPDISPEYISKIANTPENVALSENARAIQTAANAAPVGAPSSTGTLASATINAAKAPIEQGVQQVGQGGTSTADTKSFFAGLPDWAKAQMAISGAQGLAGMLGGWFDSATEEQKLDLQRQAQEWQQQNDTKIREFNQRNASYAPAVTFGSGAINRGA